MTTVIVNVERLVRLQRKVDEARNLPLRGASALYKKLDAIHHDIDSIILGKPEHDDADKR